MPQFSNSSGAMKNIQTQWGKNLSALKYLFSQMTDGEPVFKKVKEENPSTLFLRQRPTLEKSAEIPMDEADGKRMIQGFLSSKSAQSFNLTSVNSDTLFLKRSYSSSI